MNVYRATDENGNEVTVYAENSQQAFNMFPDENMEYVGTIKASVGTLLVEAE